MSTNQQLYKYNRRFLKELYQSKMLPIELMETLALMLTGLFLGRHVQLWELALWAPLPIQLTSLVRRFERFLADPRVDMRRWFEPFVKMMQRTLGYEVAYLILDCTKAGGKCRSLFAGLAYHGTVLPVGWKTLKGCKGHVKGEFQKELLQSLVPTLQCYHRVIVLGDGEFSNETVIQWLRNRGWDFVFRFRNSCLLQVTPDGEWQAMKALYQASGLQPGNVQHWESVVFTQAHRFEGLTVTVQWGIDQAQPLPLVSTLPAGESPHLLYEMRYWIETLFGNHKSRGFQLARTHLTDPQQIDRLILVLTIATVMLLGLGTTLVFVEQTHLVDRSDRRDLSLFQLGFRWFFRLLALDRLDEFAMLFSYSIHLPQAGAQWQD
jgi:Transposase DDE domain